MANVNHQPGLANAATQREFAFRIFLHPQRPIDINATEICGSFNTPQKPPLSGNHTVMNAGTISRQGIFAWVRGIINELISFNLNSMNLVPALWGQLFKIIQNHSFFKRWIFSRPRPGPMGFLTVVHDPSEEMQYTGENVLGRAQIIWQEIEADLKNEEPNQFIGEIFQQVFHIWQYKCFMNNMLMDMRGRPRTTERDAFSELVRYVLSRPLPLHNHPAPQINPPAPAPQVTAYQPAHPPQNLVGADVGIVGHPSIIGNPGNSPTRGASGARAGAGPVTGVSMAAGTLEISDDESSGQSDNTNSAFNQPYPRMPTPEPNTGRMVSTLMLSGSALAHTLRGANRVVSSAIPNAVQAGRSNIPAASVPQSNGNQQNGNVQGNGQPRPRPGATIAQSRPSQSNLHHHSGTRRQLHIPQIPPFNSAVPGSSTAGPVATQKRPATTISNTSSPSGPSRPSGKKFKMERPDVDH
ncbi:hypothetical protein ACHAP3_006510 [Botrytis cinerea]